MPRNRHSKPAGARRCKVSPGNHRARPIAPHGFSAPLSVLACGGRPPEAATAPTAPPFGAGRLWDDGRAEIDAYEAAVRRDGLPRKFTAYLIVVKEDLSRKRLAKADPGHDPADLVTVLKLNHVLDYRTGISSCRQTATCYFDRDSMELLKLSLASSDWSGSTYKEFQRRDRGGLLRVHTDRDDPAEASYDVPIGPDVVFYDQLPLWIRSLPQAVGTRRELRLLPTQIDPHAPRPEIRKGTLQAVRQEILLVKAGGFQTIRWQLDTGGGRPDVYWTARDAPHVLVAWDQPDGGGYRLKWTQRLPYWTLNRPADERYLEGPAAAAPRGTPAGPGGP